MKSLIAKFIRVRKQTEALCQSLHTEDYLLQSMPDVSPTKWHLAHTSWFFETFLLIPYLKKYAVYNSHYHYLFNSYYEALGKYHPRNKRGIISRPTVEEVYHYRKYINDHLMELQKTISKKHYAEWLRRLDLGINHEQQHQELMLMDIKYNFFCNPMRPIYLHRKKINQIKVTAMQWINFSEGNYPIGYQGKTFAYDNEYPQHTVYLMPFKIADRLVTNEEYLKFIEAGGYQKPEYWLSDGWQRKLKENWQAPLYWEKNKGEWMLMTLHGMETLNLDEPVAHVSYYEADAYARWAKARLPTEFEWEVAASLYPMNGNFLDESILHPLTAVKNRNQFFGDLWEWTQSAYAPYPGYKPFEAPLTEYNGKFACNQYVLRGGSCVTPKDHVRATYRNYFYPYQRWPFTGIRLGGDT